MLKNRPDSPQSASSQQSPTYIDQNVYREIVCRLKSLSDDPNFKKKSDPFVKTIQQAPEKYHAELCAAITDIIRTNKQQMVFWGFELDMGIGVEIVEYTVYIFDPLLEQALLALMRDKPLPAEVFQLQKVQKTKPNCMDGILKLIQWLLQRPEDTRKNDQSVMILLDEVANRYPCLLRPLLYGWYIYEIPPGFNEAVQNNLIRTSTFFIHPEGTTNLHVTLQSLLFFHGAFGILEKLWSLFEPLEKKPRLNFGDARFFMNNMLTMLINPALMLLLTKYTHAMLPKKGLHDGFIIDIEIESPYCFPFILLLNVFLTHEDGSGLLLFKQFLVDVFNQVIDIKTTDDTEEQFLWNFLDSFDSLRRWQYLDKTTSRSIQKKVLFFIVLFFGYKPLEGHMEAILNDMKNDLFTPTELDAATIRQTIRQEYGNNQFVKRLIDRAITQTPPVSQKRITGKSYKPCFFPILEGKSEARETIEEYVGYHSNKEFRAVMTALSKH